ncbi:hypothetical protein ACCO45_007545 [Purpureocillium lilacinum]|uniref:Uncharacterized protein n=1 Tax=Purpureocillium lilacinum TaxID=33203 RepID=A0ACC4DTF0_PURLI
MSQQDSSPFVITTVLGSKTFDLEAIQGGAGGATAGASETQELAWPYVPYDYEPPSAAQEDAVRQVAYIGLLLKTHAPPHAEDDLELLSLLLLSLETRGDLSRRVLQYTDAEHAIKAVSRKCDSPEANAFHLATRAKALVGHWDACNRSDDPKKDATGDISESASSDADSIFKATKMEREHACSYFRQHRPKPMAWHPKTADAWNKVDRKAAQSGDMYHLADFIPIYMGYDLQAMDVPFSWKNPDWDESQAAQYAEALDLKRQFANTKGSYPLRSEDILQTP